MAEMARGFLSGAIVGTVVSVGVAGVLSVMTGQGTAPELDSAAPSDVTAPQTGDAAKAAAPVDADLALDSGVAQVATPQADDVNAVSEAGTDPAGRPETGTAAGLEAPQVPQADATVSVDTDAPVQPGVQATLPDTPQAETELSISTEPAQPPAPEVVEDETAFAPQDPETEDPDPAPQTQTQAPAAPEDDEIIVVVPEDPAPEVPRTAQRVGSLVDRDDEPAEEETPAAPAAKPIDAFAAAFDAPADKPLMAIVLIDTGADLSGGSIGLPALRSFPYPLSFAVDATLPDAAERAAAYRAQGLEVLAMVDLPAGATPVDAEVTLNAALSNMPESVGVLEGVATGLQSSREVSDQVTDILLQSGHGFVTQSKGLNTVQKLAVREGVPAATVFRDFDSAGQTPTVIRRFLDQAAFRAGQEGGVVMLGRVQPDTISALLLWGLQDRAERVALAPVSAVLKAQLAQ